MSGITFSSHLYPPTFLPYFTLLIASLLTAFLAVGANIFIAFVNGSFAIMEINLILAHMLWKFDLELEDKDLDWEGSSHLHVMWWKPELRVRFRERV